MKPTCRNGHLRTDASTRIDKHGRPICRVCTRISQAARADREFRGGTGHRVHHTAVDKRRTA